MSSDDISGSDPVVLPDVPDYLAPDGSEVRLLCQGGRAGVAHFRLPVGRVSRAVEHRSVDEFWYVLSGSGELWRSGLDASDEVVALRAGVSVVIPAGTAFQFRNLGAAPLDVVASTVPPWPGEDEAVHVAPHWPEV